LYNWLKDAAAIAPDFTLFVSLAAFIVTFVALFVARGQLILNRKNQRETTAKATFREFLKLCVQHPDLASGTPEPGREDEYEWFIAYLLWTCEEILESAATEWENNLLLHLSYHRKFFATDQRFREEDYPCYDEAVQALIEKAIGDKAIGLVPEKSPGAKPQVP
jgi:hypothetical protein